MRGDLSAIALCSSVFKVPLPRSLLRPPSSPRLLERESSRLGKTGADWETEEVGRPVSDRVKVDGLELREAGLGSAISGASSKSSWESEQSEPQQAVATGKNLIYTYPVIICIVSAGLRCIHVHQPKKFSRPDGTRTANTEDQVAIELHGQAIWTGSASRYGLYWRRTFLMQAGIPALGRLHATWK